MSSFQRNDIGLLIWNKTIEETEKLGVGSRFKTPNLPVWVSCVNGNWGVLFNPNKDLMKSYAAENRFMLYYYSNTLTKATRETKLVIDTRGTNKAPAVIEEDLEIEDVDSEDTMERAIQTK